MQFFKVPVDNRIFLVDNHTKELKRQSFHKDRLPFDYLPYIMTKPTLP